MKPGCRHLLLFAAITTFAALPDAMSAASADSQPETPPPVFEVDATPIDRNGVVTSYADVLEPMQRTVVSVHTKIYQQAGAAGGRGRGGAPSVPLPPEEGLGSGVIVSANGYILTNNHVVADAGEITVELSDQRELTATLIGADPLTDIAVIKVEATDMPAITLADSDLLRVGDVVFAIGNPLEVGQSVTMGIVSAKSRRVGILDDVVGYEDFIQTDAAINLGNSGGALVDARGRLVMRNLVSTGTVSRGFLGVDVAEIAADLRESFGLPPGARGLAVTNVVDDSPAADAGVRREDVISSVDGRSVGTRDELRLIISQKTPGTTAELSIIRDGEARTLEVVLGTVPGTIDDSVPFLRDLTVEMLTAERRRELNLGISLEGLLVTAIEPDSENRGSLEVGMVILEINFERFADLATAKQLLRDGNNRFLVQGGRSATPRLVLVTVGD
jgi:S1-C subfamily serine protease